MVDTRVQVGQRLQDLLLLQTGRDGLRHGLALSRMELEDRLICRNREFKKIDEPSLAADVKYDSGPRL
jgi:hypothetical protein